MLPGGESCRRYLEQTVYLPEYSGGKGSDRSAKELYTSTLGINPDTTGSTKERILQHTIYLPVLITGWHFHFVGD